jgi:SPP1 family predicted phage head-tail adaptor
MLATKTSVGKRDQRIIIRSKTLTKDEFNEDYITWSTFATVWAEVKDAQGTEGYQADQLTANRTSLFDIRYLDGVTEQMQILYNDRYYEIVGIQRPDRKRSLILKAYILDET